MRKLVAVFYRDLDYEWRWFVTHKRDTVAESMKGFRAMTEARMNFEITTGLVAPSIKPDELEVTQIYLAEPRHFKRVSK